jgi:hypothetical protein
LGEAHAALLDLADNNQAKIYRSGMKALEGDKYDGSPKWLLVFLEALKSKAIMYNWFDALTVTDATGQNPRVFFQAYGTITMAECQAHATTYITASDRAAQNSMMMYHCISDSLTNDFKAELMAEADLYTILGYSEGLCFLKLLVNKAQVDTIATVNMLRASITVLRNKMVEMVGNIVEFNNYVKHLENTLISYGERSDDLLMNVFLAYGSVEHEDFVAYIKAKRNSWEEQTIVLTDSSLPYAPGRKPLQSPYPARKLVSPFEEG